MLYPVELRARMRRGKPRLDVIVAASPRGTGARRELEYRVLHQLEPDRPALARVRFIVGVAGKVEGDAVAVVGIRARRPGPRSRGRVMKVAAPNHKLRRRRNLRRLTQQPADRARKLLMLRQRRPPRVREY